MSADVSMLVPVQQYADDGGQLADVTTSEPPRKRKRVKTGCLICRARKVKCDETHPSCRNCQNLNVDCEWAEATEGRRRLQRSPSPGTRPIVAVVAPDAPPERSTSKASPRSPACFTCRYARTKCSQTRPSCDRCGLYGYECKYPDPRSNRNLTPSARSWMRRLGAENSESIAASSGRIDERQIDGNDTSTRQSPSLIPPSQLDLRHTGPNGGWSPVYDQTENDGNSHGSRTFARSHQPTQNSFPLASPIVEIVNPGFESSPIGQTDSSKNGLPSEDRIQTLAVAFFRYVHIYRANAFLHRESVLSGIRDGSISIPVVLGLCAVGARFASPREPDELAGAWAAEAGARITASSEPCKDTVAASLLLTIYMQQAGRFAQSHMWSSIAINQAIALGLHRERPSTTHCFTESERDRRLFYACYAMSRFISNGSPESIICPASRIKLRLPCDGLNWRMDVCVETPYPELEVDDSHVPGWMYKNVGAMGFWLRLVGARAMIKQYFHMTMESRETIAQEREHGQGTNSASLPVPPWSPNSPFNVCMAKLASLREHLPPRLQLSRELVTKRYDSPTFGQIVMFYMWWNECHVELCSVALPGYSQSLNEEFLSCAPEGWVEETRRQCMTHAQAMTDVLVMVDRELTRQPLTIYDHTLAHAVYLSIRVQLEQVGPCPGASTISLQLKQRFETMIGFLERIGGFFHSVQLVLKEIRRIVSKDGFVSEGCQEHDSRPETPPLPWLRRQKTLDSRREAERAAMDAANLEAVLLELLPNCTSYGAASWIRETELETSNLDWNHPPELWADPHANGSGQSTALPSTDLNTLGMMGNWGTIAPSNQLPRFDPLLP